MTRQAEANLISLLLHGIFMASVFAMPHPRMAEKPALELDFCFAAPPPAVSAPAEPMAALTSTPEEKPLPRPTPPPVVEKPKPVKPPARSLVKKTIVTQPDLPEEKPLVHDKLQTVAPLLAANGPADEEAPPASAAAAAPGPPTPPADAKAAGPPGPTAIQAAPAPLRDVPFGQDSGPAFAKRVPPEYPRQARRMGRQGKVVLRLTIDERGSLAEANIVESGGPAFDEASLNAVRASSYRPAMVHDTPVASSALLTIQFQLVANKDEG
ncbi:MAG: energy transducer TonB [Thermodesulfobacteriota bacterium]